MPGVGKLQQSIAGGGVILSPGAPSVFVEGQTISVVGDLVAGHGDPPHAAPTIATGSSTVFAENKKITIESISVATCGHVVQNGAGSVDAT